MKISKVSIFIPVHGSALICDVFVLSVYYNQQSDVSQCNLEPHLQSPTTDQRIQTSDYSFNTANTEKTSGNADITFKSFICPGEEVEITDSLHRTEESIILPQNQATSDTCETDDPEIPDSKIIQLCAEHIEHPYHNPEIRNTSPEESTIRVCGISNSTPACADMDNKRVPQEFTAVQHDVCEENDITWKSFVCGGGEVEVRDVIPTEEETVHLSMAQLDEHLHNQSINTTNLSDFVRPQHVDHTDHPYCSSDGGVAVSASECRIETTNGFQESASGPTDVTFKSFNCTGGEVQISDGTTLADETVPLPADQCGACSDSCIYSVDPSMLASCQDVQNTDHLDHLYCNVQSNLSITEGPSPVDISAVNEAKGVSLTFSDGQTNRQECVTYASLKISGSEYSDSPQLSHKSSLLADDQAVLCQAMDYNIAPAVTIHSQSQENCKQLNNHLENNDVNPPTINSMPPANSSSENSIDKSLHSQMQETPKEDTAFPAHQQRPEFSQCSHPEASSETLTPSQVQLSSGPEEASEDKDSALGSSGNEPVVCNSAEKHTENFSDVLKALSECPSVASALQLGLLSPVVRRASLFLSGAKRDPAVAEFLTDDSALEVEKSLLAPVNVNTTGLWAEHMDSPMPRPLLNSTAVGGRLQPSEDVGVTQPEVEKPPLDIPLVQDGPLQQQLRHMAEFLFLLSGKHGPAAVSAPPQPPTVVPVLSARAPPAESCSVCVGTSPVKFVNHSINTSGQFERKRNFTVVDSCTLTDPLLWK